MKAWQTRLEQLLSDDDAPPVLTRDMLARFARTARHNSERQAEVPASTLTHWLKQTVQSGKLVPVKRGLYLNHYRPTPGQLADATPLLYRDAVVSLNTVLGEAGVLNNPSHAVTAVVPVDKGHPPPHLGRQQTRAGVFHFFGMPRSILEAGKTSDRIASLATPDHVRATPEKALVDWLYLASSPRSRRTIPPRDDIDLDMLDRRRLQRLADAAGISEALRTWIDARPAGRNAKPDA
jgi:hypothetical protein